MKRHRTIHANPTGDMPTTAPRDAIALEFGRRLQRKMTEHGWNQSELARRASDHMIDGKQIGRDSISYYINGRFLPTAERLEAICKALGMEKAELLPTRGVGAATRIAPPFEMTSLDDGRVWVRVNQALNSSAALKIMAILNEEKAA